MPLRKEQPCRHVIWLERTKHNAMAHRNHVQKRNTAKARNQPNPTLAETAKYKRTSKRQPGDNETSSARNNPTEDRKTKFRGPQVTWGYQ